jgi:NAD(P)H dehydrogenase (quinone)
MHALIVLAHPEAKSFNGQMAETAKAAFEAQGHTAEISDLYREGFDAREALMHFPAPKAPDYFSAMTEQRHAVDTATLPPDVEREIRRLERADVVVFQFPLWWFSIPGMLKGWMDRVFVWGRVYTSKMRYDTGYFSGKRALISITTGGPPVTHAPNGRQGDMDLELWPFHFGLNYVGFTVLPPFRSFAVGVGPENDAYRAMLDGYKAGLRDHLSALDRLEPLKFNGWNDWDESGRLKPDAPSHSPFMRHDG